MTTNALGFGAGSTGTQPNGFHHPYGNGVDDYSADDLETLKGWASLQLWKDRLMVKRWTPHLKPGTLLEFGAGSGQMSVLFRNAGMDVIASDAVPSYVDHLHKTGLKADQIDMLASPELFSQLPYLPVDNVFCQCVSPLICSDEQVLTHAYESVLSCLVPGGVFLNVHSMAPRSQIQSVKKAHVDIARRVGFRTVLFAERNQIAPSSLYKPPVGKLVRVAERALGAKLGNRLVLAFQK